MIISQLVAQDKIVLGLFVHGQVSKYKLHTEQELFEKAYSYIREPDLCGYKKNQTPWICLAWKKKIYYMKFIDKKFNIIIIFAIVILYFKFGHICG